MLTIEKIKEIITPICKSYGIKKAYLFGSYVRGEATEKSNVDIRIEKSNLRGLFQLSRLRLDLVDALGTEVYLLSILPDPQYKKFRENLKKR